MLYNEREKVQIVNELRIEMKMNIRGQILLDFRLHSEGSNKNPLWGIAFRHKADVPAAVDIINRPSEIEIEFPDKKIYKFGIRPCFWKDRNPCLEFVDARVKEGTSPIRDLAIGSLGYGVSTKGKCVIKVEVVRRNKRLRIVTFR